MEQLGTKEWASPCGAGVTEEPSPAWLPAPTATSCSAPALGVPWSSTTVLSSAATSYMWQVRLQAWHPGLLTYPVRPCGPSAVRRFCSLTVDPQGKCGFRTSCPGTGQ